MTSQHDGKGIDRDALDACVHCGFCLPACPTYDLTGDEADSPRGRVALIRRLAEGRVEDLSVVEHHLDRCLGCRACETACPSAVPYGRLLEEARAALPPRSTGRALRAALASPTRTRLLLTAIAAARTTGLLTVAQRLPGRLGRAARLAPPASWRPHSRTALSDALAGPAGRALLLPGCVMDQGFADVQRSTTRLLRATGFGVTVPEGPLCCGALHAHAGDADGSRRLSDALRRVVARAAPDVVVTDAAGCGAHLVDLLDAPVRDVTALVVETGPPSFPSPVAAAFGVSGRRLRVAFDPPCHLLHGQRVVGAAEQLLRAVGDVDLVPFEGADRCCGAAGTYALDQPELADRVLAEKLGALGAAAPDVVATANPGCQSWLAAGLRRAAPDGPSVPVVHVVTLLAGALAPE